MRKWLVLGLVLVGVVWGPFVYTELSRSPEKGHGRGRQAFGFFGDDDSDTAASDESEAEDPDQAPADKPAEKAAEGEKAAEEATEQKPAAEGEPVEGAEKGSEVAADEEEEEIPPPVWPTVLVPAFRKTFEAEPRDGFWAETAEPKLRAELQTAGVAASVVSEVACRKTVCRVAFSVEKVDPDAEHKLFEAIEKEHGPSVALDEKHSEAAVALYVLRPGYKLEP